jgi:CRISPR-associated protein Cas2
VADRTRYLLAYDIREPRRLRRVHRVAKDFGEPLQYSLFVCDLTRVELSRLKGSLIEEIKTTEDSISIFDLGPPSGRGVHCIEFMGRRSALPSDDPAIW